MREYFLISLLILLPGCAWIATHPVEDAEIIMEGESIIKKFYEYETGKILPPYQDNAAKE